MCNITKIHPWHLGENVGDGRTNWSKNKDLPFGEPVVDKLKINN
jgi:hypothetical protein